MANSIAIDNAKSVILSKSGYGSQEFIYNSTWYLDTTVPGGFAQVPGQENRFGIRTVNAAIRELLEEGKIYIASSSVGRIYSTADYGFKSALKSRNWATYTI
ncbi:hypothetical protein [Spirosoma sp. KUDC1026]|uniref:hypothetical protein n=1 Tax=Spirosoma sp. KUDC1026 TaxID=2745947 RepID=UPI00159BCA08|nr:hypothetical protein [Spirosoma sp. KUDC1026]QKZ15170.1 hypothetical protein HU175_22115 [Spirosoma sp. KUDC1026]